MMPSFPNVQSISNAVPATELQEAMLANSPNRSANGEKYAWRKANVTESPRIASEHLSGSLRLTVYTGVMQLSAAPVSTKFVAKCYQQPLQRMQQPKMPRFEVRKLEGCWRMRRTCQSVSNNFSVLPYAYQWNYECQETKMRLHKHTVSAETAAKWSLSEIGASWGMEWKQKPLDAFQFCFAWIST